MDLRSSAMDGLTVVGFTADMTTSTITTTTDPSTRPRPGARPASAPADGRDDRPIALLGGTGKTGRRIAERLDGLGRPARAASRRTTPRFDWGEPATWGPVLDGVGAAYVAYHPDVS